MTKVAVPINATTVQGILDQVDQGLEAGADVLEWRSDYLEGITADLATQLIHQIQLRIESKAELLVTCRDRAEGGACALPLDLRVDVLTRALKAKVQYIDIEYANYRRSEVRLALERALDETPFCRLILSAHDFDGRFDDIQALYKSMVTHRPDAIVKLVYTASHINDCFEAFDVLHARQSDAIALCMGPAGMVSRLLAPKLGGFLTFACLDEASATAPGQMTVQQYRTLYRPDGMNQDTELYGILADPVGHSMSPAIHNACFLQMDLNKRYLPFWVTGTAGDFDRFLDHLQDRPWLKVRGFSVTIPHKLNALEYTRAKGGVVEALAEKIGAVNTLVMDPDTGRPEAYNTDYAGAMDAICQTLGIEWSGLADKSVAVVGAGGVSRAIVAGLTDVGARVCVYNRTVSKARDLAETFACEYAGLDALNSMRADLLVNGTSLGMAPNVDSMPVPDSVLDADMAVFDTVYNPLRTRLLEAAQAKGAPVIDGLAMFVGQAMAQYKLFTGQTGDAQLMREKVMAQLGER